LDEACRLLGAVIPHNSKQRERERESKGVGNRVEECCEGRREKGEGGTLQ
jgi:hypothetical protein